MNLNNSFEFDDVAQQMVGSLLIAAPFLLTEEVWSIASDLSVYNLLWIFTSVSVIGYVVLYVAVVRDPEIERDFAGFPVRFVALILIVYSILFLFAIGIGIPRTLSSADGLLEVGVSTFRAVTVVSPFGVLGAGAADSVVGPG